MIELLVTMPWTGVQMGVRLSGSMMSSNLHTYLTAENERTNV